jgi:hypothetical protein
MPSHWLFERLREMDPSWEPQFAARSARSWMGALRLELHNEYGSTPEAQSQACRTLFTDSILPARSSRSNGEVFGPLYASLVHVHSLREITRQLHQAPAVQPIGVIQWYYALYFATRSMLMSQGQTIADNHSALKRAFVASLAGVMPHPFNMVATRTEGEEYSLSLPSKSLAQSFDLQKLIEGNRDRAQGMLLQYLKGTADYWTDEVKEDLRDKHKLQNFRTKQAQALRDARLEQHLGFFHCAYRYRGKANYRDAVFLTYGARPDVGAKEFLEDLSSVAQFYFVCAAAFVARRLGPGTVRDFVQDCKANLRGLPERDALVDSLL